MFYDNTTLTWLEEWEHIRRRRQLGDRKCRAGISSNRLATTPPNEHHPGSTLGRMGSPRLPSELTDRIIDFCHNNKRTLSNCALTHSSWLAASRFHLFHTITTTGAYERVERAIQLKSIVHKKPSASSYRQSHILPYIKTVKIESFANPDQVTQLKNATRIAETVRQLCDHEQLPVPSVHATLGQPLSQSDAPLIWSLDLVHDIVTHVKLLNLTFGHPSDIWSFLSSFPRLQCLELECIGFNNSAGFSPPAGVFDDVPLSTIRITTAFMGIIINNLTQVASSLSYLEDFGIAYQDNMQGALPQLADAIQARVKCLRFTADCYPGKERGNEWRPSAFDTSEQTSPTPAIQKLTVWIFDRDPRVCRTVSVTRHPLSG